MVKKPAIAAGVIFCIASFGCASMGDFASDDPKFAEAPGQFEGRFVSLSDADMAATAYADGVLEPFEGARDAVTLFNNGAAGKAVAASNSVVSWPQIAVAAPGGGMVYVIETRGSLANDIERVESAYTAFPQGRVMTVFAVSDDEIVEVDQRSGIGENPQSIDISADGRFLALSTETPDAELTVIPLDADGGTGAPRPIALNPPYRPTDKEKRVRTLHISPDGKRIAANIANLRYQFYDFIFDENDIPAGVRPVGAPVEFGVRLSIGRWSQNGRYFIATDVNSYDASLRMLIQKGGQVHVIKAPTAAEPGALVTSKRVGRFAEGLEMSDDGALIASIAMERTYLPELFFLEAWPRRRQYMLTLFSFDEETGALIELDRIRSAGVLPEDVIFDTSGRNLAVAVFHRRKGANRKRGFIDFFHITEKGELRAQGKTQSVMRGPHDLVRLAE